MSILLLLMLAFGAAIAAAVIIIRWALSRSRPASGFPLDAGMAQPLPPDDLRQ